MQSCTFHTASIDFLRERTSDLERRTAEILAQSEQLREVSARLLRFQDEERRRIACELHDSAGQTLSALGIEQSRLARRLGDASDLVGQMRDIQDLTEQLTREIRTTSYLLHPPLLDDGGLAGALHWYVEGITTRSGFSIDLQMPKNFGRVPAVVELTLFRIVQEGLTNIIRHSGSGDAVISIRRDENFISLEIRDHGAGMPPEKLAQIQSQSGDRPANLFIVIKSVQRLLHKNSTVGKSAEAVKVRRGMPMPQAGLVIPGTAYVSPVNRQFVVTVAIPLEQNHFFRDLRRVPLVSIYLSVLEPPAVPILCCHSIGEIRANQSRGDHRKPDFGKGRFDNKNHGIPPTRGT